MQQQLLLLVLMFGMMYFLIIRPQQKQQKQRKAMLDSLKVGTRVVTIGGIHGTIKALTHSKVVLEIARGVQVDVLRSAIGQLEQEDLLDGIVDKEEEEEKKSNE